MNILISINDGYIKYAKMMLKSLKMSNNVNLDIYLLYDDITDDNLKDFKEYVDSEIGTLHAIKFEEDIDFPMNVPHITRETYFRLFAPYILTDLDRILYLDCDLIVRMDISDFYNLKMNDYVIAGAINFDSDNPLYLERLGISEDHRYINAGVLLFELNNYRNFITKKEIIDYINNNYENLVYQDQDVINYLFRDKIREVGFTFNYQITQILDGYEEYGYRIVHFCNKYKPWNDNFRNPDKGKDYYEFLYSIGEGKEADRLKAIHTENYKSNQTTNEGE